MNASIRCYIRILQPGNTRVFYRNTSTRYHLGVVSEYFNQVTLGLLQSGVVSEYLNQVTLGLLQSGVVSEYFNQVTLGLLQSGVVSEHFNQVTIQNDCPNQVLYQNTSTR